MNNPPPLPTITIPNIATDPQSCIVELPFDVKAGQLLEMKWPRKDHVHSPLVTFTVTEQMVQRNSKFVRLTCKAIDTSAEAPSTLDGSVDSIVEERQNDYLFHKPQLRQISSSTFTRYQVSRNELRSKYISYFPPQSLPSRIKSKSTVVRSVNSLYVLNDVDGEGIRLVNEEGKHIFTLMSRKTGGAHYQYNQQEATKEVLSACDSLEVVRKMKHQHTVNFHVSGPKLHQRWYSSSSSSYQMRKNNKILNWIDSTEQIVLLNFDMKSTIRNFLQRDKSSSAMRCPSLRCTKNIATNANSNPKPHKSFSIIAPLLRQTFSQKVLVHVCFPTAGVAIALRCGDILVLDNDEVHCISEKEPWTAHHDLIALTLDYENYGQMMNDSSTVDIFDKETFTSKPRLEIEKRLDTSTQSLLKDPCPSTAMKLTAPNHEKKTSGHEKQISTGVASMDITNKDIINKFKNNLDIKQVSPCQERRMNMGEHQSRRVVFCPRTTLSSLSNPLIEEHNILFQDIDSLQILNDTRGKGMRLFNEVNQHVFTLMPRRYGIEYDDQKDAIMNVGSNLLTQNSTENIFSVDLDRIELHRHFCIRKAVSAQHTDPSLDSHKLLDWTRSIENYCRSYIAGVDPDLDGMFTFERDISERDKDTFPYITYSRNYASYCRMNDNHYCSIFTPLFRSSSDSSIDSSHDSIEPCQERNRVLLHVCFPALGVAVALRDGDILLFKPEEVQQHCISRKEKWTDIHDVEMMMISYGSLFLNI